MRKVSASPSESETRRTTSSKLRIFSPLIARMRSPALKPAAAAGLSSPTPEITGCISVRPTSMKLNVKITKASTKFASGPAATIAARLPTD
jgi:hypothetical protein